MSDTPWPIFRIDDLGWPEAPHDDVAALPPAPVWRRFGPVQEQEPKGPQPPEAPLPFLFRKEEADLINAALFLRRPLLITGDPGSGKSSLAHAVAWQLRLGPLLRWPINTRSTLREGLYRYDAIARLQDHQLDDGGQPEIQDYLTLGPLGTALLPRARPRCLLIDEIDKSDLDLPNDLLDVLETGSFLIEELARLKRKQPEVFIEPDGGGAPWPITEGRVGCHAFPLVVMTSNGERVFPPPFLRRVIRLEMKPPDKDMLARIIEEKLHLQAPELIKHFLGLPGVHATDQLLNAVALGGQGIDDTALRDALLQALDG